VAYWTATDEPKNANTLIYILKYPSREAATAGWKSFQVDPEWQQVKSKSEESGKLVEKVDSTFMVTDGLFGERGLRTQGGGWRDSGWNRYQIGSRGEK
jgi:NIPSNAP